MKFPLLGGACLQALLLMSLVMEGCDGKVIGRSKHPACLSLRLCLPPALYRGAACCWLQLLLLLHCGARFTVS